MRLVVPEYKIITWGTTTSVKFSSCLLNWPIYECKHFPSYGPDDELTNFSVTIFMKKAEASDALHLLSCFTF